MRDEFCECPDCRPDPAEVKALRARVAALEAALRHVEWNVVGHDGWWCPSCGATKKRGHTPDECTLAAALAPRSERREGSEQRSEQSAPAAPKEEK